MPSSYTASARFTLQATGENNNTWGVILNQGVFQLVDDTINGRLGFALSGAKVLTTVNGATDEARMNFLDVTGGAGGTITIPAASKSYFLRNASAGAVVLSAGGAVNASFNAGDAGPVVSDGASVYPMMIAGRTVKGYVDAAIASASGMDLPPVLGEAGHWLTNNGVVANWAALPAVAYPVPPPSAPTAGQFLTNDGANLFWALTGPLIVFQYLAQAVAAHIPAGTSYVRLLGYYIGNDFGGGTYVAAGAGAGPGKFQSADGAWWALYELAPNVLQFGAKGDGATDDLAAYTGALAYMQSRGGVVTVPTRTAPYIVSAGFTIPDGVTLSGDSFFGNQSVPTGPRLQFPVGTAICVTLGSGTSNSAGLQNLIIGRAGVPAAGTTGVLVNKGYLPALKNVAAMNHGVGFYFYAQAGGVGWSCFPTGLYTAKIVDAHIVVDNWPSLDISQSRFGSSSGDYACTTYVRFTNQSIGSPAGPNSILFSQCEFAQSGASASHFAEWVNIAGTGGVANFFKFHQCTIFSLSGAVFSSDATCTQLNRLDVTSCQINPGGVALFALNAATTPVGWTIHGNQIFTTTFNLSPTAAPLAVSITNNYTNANATIVNPANGYLSFANNVFNNFTISGAGAYHFNGDVLTGAWNCAAATGVLLVSACNFTGARSAIPQLRFGGNQVGLTYTVQSGSVEYLTAKTLRWWFQLQLNNKGSSVGAATISGGGGPLVNAAGAGICSYATSMAGMTGPVMLSPAGGGTSLNLYQQAATGITNVTDANFTSATFLIGEIIYDIQ